MGREPDTFTELRRALGARLAVFRKAAGLTQEQLAQRLYCDRTTVAHMERGRGRGSVESWQAADTAVGADGVLVRGYGDLAAAQADYENHIRDTTLADVRARAEALRQPASGDAGPTDALLLGDNTDVEAAWELARRVAASDVTDETLTRLERVFDELATAYPVTPPPVLLEAVRHHLGYVSTLLDKKATLAEHHRLIVVGGWLSLLAATVHVDLKHQHAATAHLRTAANLARHAGHREIRAWCFETDAWRVLTDGNYPQAVELSKAAQHHAPKGSSVAIQAIAQEGRAWARLGQKPATYSAIGRVQKLVSPMPRPQRPEHHYRYDPDKSVAYTATTLAWVGDHAAERYAREIIARLKPAEEIGKWPRRVAAANLDLALTLLVTDRLDEACHAAKQAIESGRVVPSNHWRAAEVIAAVEHRGLPEATDLRDAYHQLTHGTI